MTRTLRIWPAVLLAISLTRPAAAAPAPAVPAVPAAPQADVGDPLAEQAKQHFQRGVTSYKDGDLDAALAEFNKAYETRPDYRVLYNIGQVQAERHDNATAITVLRQYLKDGDAQLDTERRASVEQTLRDLAKRVGAVTINVNVPDAEVLIDGTSVATMPLAAPLVVNAGVREITVRKGGETAPARRVTVAGGDSLQLDFRLGGGPGPALAAPVAAPVRPIPTRVWIAYGAAAALGATAGTFALLTRRADQNLDADLAHYPGDRAQIDGQRTALKWRAGLTDGFAAAAVIAAGVGTYFLLAGPSGSESASGQGRSTQVSLAPSPSGAALSVSGAF
ncbi:MAG TPA: hypothetical protein VHU40_05355 [Polyangia bacterium]|nr:hypothetical protein [Polyangia bacterium]